MTIVEPGRYELALEDYHGQPCDRMSMSASDAIVLSSLTPAHLLTAWNKPRERARKVDFGTALHAVVLEYFRAEDRIVVISADDFRKKDVQEAADRALNAGKTPLLVQEYERVRRAADALNRHPQVSKLLSHGIAEESWFAKDDDNGIWLKARPDFFTEDRIILDLKSVGSCETDFLKRRILDGGWYQQAPWYCDVVERVQREPAADYLWICIEQAEPHAIRVVRPPEATLAAGACENERARVIFGECAQKNSWPPYAPVIEEFGLPDYAHFRLEDKAADANAMSAARLARELNASPFV